MLWLQKTVAEPVSMSGVGLHTGQDTKITFRPAEPNSGLVFHARTEAGEAEIHAVIENVPDGEAGVRNTMLAKGDVTIFTVEHVLSALYGMGITNCIIELEGPEPPITNCGSAQPYVEMIEKAGIVQQGLPASYYRITNPVAWRQDGIEIVAEPADEFRLTCWVDYDDPLIGEQEITFEIRPGVFAKEIAPARTFAFKQDVVKLREMGYAQGGSLESALVIDDGKLMGDQSFRFPEEIVRHKLLDLLGDLALLGMPIQGHIRARRSGHASNAAFTRVLAKHERRSSRIFPRRNPDSFDISAILEVMPHRYPFLLIDQVRDLEPGKRVIGMKNVTMNEPFFQGHFPGHPIMPGVLILEAMAQAGGVLLLTSVEDPRGKLVYFSGIDGARFRRPVLPGDVLTFECEMVRLKGPIAKMRGVARVGDDKVAEADLMASLVDA